MNKYSLVKNNSIKDAFVVFIKVDENDGDYLHSRTQYSKKDFEENILDCLILLLRDYSRPRQLLNFDYFWEINIPTSDFIDRPHSLIEVEVKYYDEAGEPWDVQFNY